MAALVRLARAASNDLFGLSVAYEFYALCSGRVPPITGLCRKNPTALLPVALIFLAHVYIAESRNS